MQRLLDKGVLKIEGHWPALAAIHSVGGSFELSFELGFEPKRSSDRLVDRKPVQRSFEPALAGAAGG
jgi:hypothetical protein